VTPGLKAAGAEELLWVSAACGAWGGRYKDSVTVEWVTCYSLITCHDFSVDLVTPHIHRWWESGGDNDSPEFQFTTIIIDVLWWFPLSFVFGNWICSVRHTVYI
jgi:hypothetical protein